HIGGVGVAALLIVEVVNNNANRQAEKTVKLAHPFRVAFGEVVVDSDDVNAASTERVQINRESGDQGLAFTGLHFRNLALVQHHSADQLHVEVAHIEDAAACLA